MWTIHYQLNTQDGRIDLGAFTKRAMCRTFTFANAQYEWETTIIDGRPGVTIREPGYADLAREIDELQAAIDASTAEGSTTSLIEMSKRALRMMRTQLANRKVWNVPVGHGCVIDGIPWTLTVIPYWHVRPAREN